MFYEILIVLYVLVAAAIIFLVLIQHGKGADMGASFGAGASGTIFGSRGTGNFLTRSTSTLAVAFFALSLLIGNYNTGKGGQKSEFEQISAPAAAEAQKEQPKPAEAQKEDPASKIPVGN